MWWRSQRLSNCKQAPSSINSSFRRAIQEDYKYACSDQTIWSFWSELVEWTEMKPTPDALCKWLVYMYWQHLFATQWMWIRQATNGFVLKFQEGLALYLVVWCSAAMINHILLVKWWIARVAISSDSICHIGYAKHLCNWGYEKVLAFWSIWRVSQPSW